MSSVSCQREHHMRPGPTCIPCQACSVVFRTGAPLAMATEYLHQRCLEAQTAHGSVKELRHTPGKGSTAPSGPHFHTHPFLWFLRPCFTPFLPLHLSIRPPLPLACVVPAMLVLPFVPRTLAYHCAWSPALPRRVSLVPPAF